MFVVGLRASSISAIEPRRGMVVEVGDRDVRVASTDRGHQLCGGERTTALGEEVHIGGAADPDAEHIGPQLGQPQLGLTEFHILIHWSAAARQGGPGQRIAINLSRSARGQFVDEGESGPSRWAGGG